MDAGEPAELDEEPTGKGPDPAEPRNALAGEDDWTKFRARVDREWRQRRANAGGDPAGLAGPPPSGYGAAEYQVGDLGRQPPGAVPPGTLPPGTLPGGPDSPRFSAFPPIAPGGGPVRRPVKPRNQPSRSQLSPVPAPAENSGLVRPYFRTGGRTRPSYDLAVEALVSTSERGRVLDSVKVPEHRTICGLCLDTRSVAEVAAYLRLPLGVVRVLIGDVAGLGLVLVHTATATVGDRPSIEFMERVLSGLRRI